MANSCFEDLEKGAVGVGELVFGALDVANLHAGVVVGNGNGADGAGGAVDVVAVHVAVEKGDVVVVADQLLDRLDVVGAEHDVRRHALEHIADAAIVFDEFVAIGDVRLLHGFSDGDAFCLPIRRLGTDAEHIFIFEKRREAQLRTLHAGGEEDDAQRVDAAENRMIDLIAFGSVDSELQI